MSQLISMPRLIKYKEGSPTIARFGVKGLVGSAMVFKVPDSTSKNWMDSPKGYALDIEFSSSVEAFHFKGELLHIEKWYPTYIKAAKEFGRIGRAIKKMKKLDPRGYKWDQINVFKF